MPYALETGHESDRPSFSAPPPAMHGSRPDILLPNRSGDERSCLTLWKRDMRVDGLLRDKTRPPATPPLRETIGERVAGLTRRGPPCAATHWTGPAMAKAAGISL